MKRTASLLMFGCLVLALAVPLTAAPTEQPLATVQAGGTVVRVSPAIAFEKATLRVSGPDYSMSKQVAHGSLITADLLAEADARAAGQNGASGDGQIAVLRDGRYNYDVVFTDAVGHEQIHSGLFFVENGALVSREQMRSKLDTVAADLAADKPASDSGPGLIGPDPGIGTEDDWFFVVDGANDNNTYMGLDSDGGLGNNLYWTFWNVGTDLQIVEDTNFTPPGTTRMTFERGGDIGIGTTAPADRLHIVDSFPLRLTSGSFDFRANIGGTGLWWYDDDSDAVVKMNHSAPINALVIDGAGVGVGVSFPEADIHIANVDGVGDTVFKFATTTDSWNFGLTAAAGVLTFNKAGTGGQEFTIRERNHAVATLDVQGHVRGTSFISTSSRALKTGFEALDSAAVLAKLEQLPVTSWRYKTEGEDVRHFGPVAEDFQRLFGLGDGVSIASVDADGVLMAAVKGLNAEVKAKDAKIEALEARLAAIEEKLAALTP